MLLPKIKEFVNRVSSKYTNIDFSLRGSVFMEDKLLKGTTRFSRKLGRIGLVCPDIELTLEKELQNNETVLTPVYLNEWFQPEYIIEVNNLERFLITIVDNGKINFDRNVKTEHPIGTSVKLYAVPLKSLFTQEKGTTDLMIRSKHLITTGDILAFNTKVAGFYTEIKINKVIKLTDTDNEYFYSYRLQLDKAIPDKLSIDDTLYLRAYPAYFSPIIKIPANASGPVLLDIFKGTIQRGKQQDLQISATFYDDLFNPIGDKIQEIELNHLISNRTISSDFLLFWDVSKGSYKINNLTTKCVCDSDGKFFASIKLLPTITENIDWTVALKSSNDAFMRVSVNPKHIYEIDLQSHESKTTNIKISQNTATSMDLAIQSVAGAEIEISDWIVDNPIQRFEYSFVVKENREAFWLGSGPIIKPYFLSKTYLITQYDEDDTYDSGFINL